MNLLYRWIPTIAAGFVLMVAALILHISMRHQRRLQETSMGQGTKHDSL